jgi:hypothetical protein
VIDRSGSRRSGNEINGINRSGGREILEQVIWGDLLEVMGLGARDLELINRGVLGLRFMDMRDLLAINWQ